MECKYCNKPLTGKHRHTNTFCCNTDCKSEYLRQQYVGKRYHMLVVIASYPDRKVRCRCDCGKEVVVFLTNIIRKKPNTTSCGCVWLPAIRRALTKHGHSPAHGKNSITYSTWSSMKVRCYIPSSTVWEYYGGRGITICKRWRDSFENFLEDMGERPSLEYSIDRINNNKNYTPSNCRWATMSEQAFNRRPKKG